MKKTIFLMAAAALAGGMLTSCKEDTQPRLEQPTEFVLNTPPTAGQIQVLTKEGPGSTVYLTCSQPNYGLGTPTHYEVQLSYTRDFAEYFTLPTVGTQAKIAIEAEEFAVGMNYLSGIKEEGDKYLFKDDPREVFVRLRAYIPYADYSSILSNVISIWAQPFFAVRVPAKIYLVGEASPYGWTMDNGFVLDETENGIGSNIYSGKLHIDAGKATFRFYSQLGDWENNSIGTQNEDKAIAYPGFPDEGDGSTLETDVIVGQAEKEGKGSWSFPDWPGGVLKITVDLNTKKAYFEALELD